MFEARAILLGKLGRHDSTLELYVYRLRDYDKAEQYADRLSSAERPLTLHRYCKRIYQPDTETRNIFLTLLRIYLRPLVKTTDDLLRPALELIARHGSRLDPEETLQLLPPLVSARDVRVFLTGALRVPRFDARVVREVALSRKDQVARKLMYLEANRVKITDSRMYVINVRMDALTIYITITLVVHNVTRGSDLVPLSYMHLGKVPSLPFATQNNSYFVVAKSRTITAAKHSPRG